MVPASIDNVRREAREEMRGRETEEKEEEEEEEEDKEEIGERSWGRERMRLLQWDELNSSKRERQMCCQDLKRKSFWRRNKREAAASAAVEVVVGVVVGLEEEEEDDDEDEDEDADEDSCIIFSIREATVTRFLGDIEIECFSIEIKIFSILLEDKRSFWIDFSKENEGIEDEDEDEDDDDEEEEEEQEESIGWIVAEVF